ncbi:MAG TPA: hypothetical protein VGM56_06425 [Byssovorax sp.]|jgi:hypothetical protein
MTGSASGGGGGAVCDPAAEHSSDPHNCGACGHDCLGAACSAGVCQPVAIWTGNAAPPLFVDDTYVYWMRIQGMGEHDCSAFTVVRAPKHSGALSTAPEQVLDEGAADVAVRDGYVNYGTRRCGLADGSFKRFPSDFVGIPPITTLGSWQYGGAGLAAGAGELYVVVLKALGDPPPVDIVALPLAGGVPTTLASPTDGSRIVTDDTNLYWGSLNRDTITAMPLAGGAPFVMVSNQDLGVGAVTLGLVDAGSLYYADSSGFTGKLHRLNVGDSGNGEVLYAPPGGFVQIIPSVGGLDIATSGADVCFQVTASTESIVCVPKAGGAAREIVPGVQGMEIETLAADDAAIYWIESPGTTRGTVYRVAK